jgi:hypothetical protein
MTSKAIISLQKQNDSIYSSLLNKSIQFERIVITEGLSEEEHLKLLSEENLKLKEIVKANKPEPVPKEPKPPKEQSQPKVEKVEKKESANDEDEEENFEEPVKKFNTITNMEDIKRSFFGSEYLVFEEQVKQHNFKFYKVQYKYNSDKDGAPEFSAKNLLKGFVRNFDDYRKYFMICFRCWKNQTEPNYKYDSLWIVNTIEPISNIIGSTYDDFEFEETSDIDDFIQQIKKLPESESESDEPIWINGYTCIGESYVH